MFCVPPTILYTLPIVAIEVEIYYTENTQHADDLNTDDITTNMLFICLCMLPPGIKFQLLIADW